MYKYYENLENYNIAVSNKGKIVNFFLPKGFFITPNGYLYNTSKTNGHKFNSFVNEYYYILQLLKENKELPKFKLDIDYYKNEMNNIRGYDLIDYETLEAWVNLLYDFPINYSLKINDNEKKLANQVILSELYKGFCDASIKFYEFFHYNFNDNPLSEYNDIEKILGNVNINDKMVEILVRCIGFHKIELHNGYKNITTASLYPISDFYDYLMNGYNIWIVPKIINDCGFKEIDLNTSIPISSFTAIENFEEENPDKGKVRILGM